MAESWDMGSSCSEAIMKGDTLLKFFLSILEVVTILGVFNYNFLRV